MKRIVPLVLAALALAVAPAALAGPRDGGGHGHGAARGVSLEKQHLGVLKHRLRIAARCAKLAASGSTADSAKAQRCADLLAKLPEKLQQFDAKVQQRIAAIQQACPSDSTDRTCERAARLLPFLQKLDQRLQDMIAQVQQLQAGSANG